MYGKISLAGDLGSGKSTVSDILIERLGAEYYSTGAIVRSIARKKGMDVGDFNRYMESHPEIDREIDNGLCALSDVDKLMIIDSRLAWYFTKGTFKVYLSTDTVTSALRIMQANRQGEHKATLEESIEATKFRRESEKRRYREQYGVDIKDLHNYDLIVDTTVATPDEVAECVVRGFERWLADPEYKAVFISAERINYPSDPVSEEYVAKLSAALERGEHIPDIEVIEEDGEFYLSSGLEAVMARTFNMESLLPARLVTGKRPENVDYIRMGNSL